MRDEVVCRCGEVAQIKREYFGKSVIWVIECPKCQVKVMAMSKTMAIRNFKK